MSTPPLPGGKRHRPYDRAGDTVRDAAGKPIALIGRTPLEWGLLARHGGRIPFHRRLARWIKGGCA